MTIQATDLPFVAERWRELRKQVERLLNAEKEGHQDQADEG